MPKLKTHSGAKKRFSLTKSGKVKRAHAFKSHLLNGHGIADPYMCMADFESYRMMHNEVNALYENDPTEWNRKSLMNIAGAGKFAADRSIGEYADRIWNIKRMTGKK